MTILWETISSTQVCYKHVSSTRDHNNRRLYQYRGRHRYTFNYCWLAGVYDVTGVSAALHGRKSKPHILIVFFSSLPSLQVIFNSMTEF
jgi:hypothetical protein